MNLFAKLLGAAALLVSFSASADSQINDVERMYRCGGVVILSEAANGDLALKFEGRGSQCNQLRFYDVTSGRTLKSYVIQGSSYTLSKTMRDSLSSDCRVGFQVYGPYTSDTFTVNLLNRWNCGWQRPQPQPQPSTGIGFQLSNAGNCKLMRYGQYQNRNVEISFCQTARGNDIISYEYSNANNCKLMRNGQFSNQLVSQRFCSARF